MSTIDFLSRFHIKSCAQVIFKKNTVAYITFKYNEKQILRQFYSNWHLYFDIVYILHVCIHSWNNLSYAKCQRCSLRWKPSLVNILNQSIEKLKGLSETPGASLLAGSGFPPSNLKSVCGPTSFPSFSLSRMHSSVEDCRGQTVAWRNLLPSTTHKYYRYGCIMVKPWPDVIFYHLQHINTIGMTV